MEKADEEILKRHVSNLDNGIFAVFNLPPEVVAVLFAYYSRSNLSLRESLLALLKNSKLGIQTGNIFSPFEAGFEEAKKKAAEFHEKYVVRFGHGSVAEHAFASLAIENISILATKLIEDSRLASFTERSTRYQIFDKNRYYKPKNLMASSLGKLYEKTCNETFDLYAVLTPKIESFVKQQFPRPPGLSEAAYKSKCKSKYCDIVRYLLPTATLTSLGMTANARSFTRAITKLCSSPLEEMQSIGLQMQQELSKIIPTLLKNAGKSSYIVETDSALSKKAKEFSFKENPKKAVPVKLVSFDKKALDIVVAGILYKHSSSSFESILKKIKSLPENEKDSVIEEALKKHGNEAVLRELEHVNFVFDVLVDYGAFRDIQRHRICTQTNQLLSTRYGYSIPEGIVQAGFKQEFENTMSNAASAFEEISKEFPFEAQYVLPLAFRKRVLFSFNLRELHHFVPLRTRKAGHISYRKIAWDCLKELEKVQPVLAKYIEAEDPSAN